MRHRLKGKKLGRTASHKKATMRSLSMALLTHHRIVTTLSKAKELRRYVEPLVNRGKEDNMHNRREAFSFLQDNATVSKLFDEIGPKVGDRQGGYTRVIKMGTRVGDSAQMAIIELVDYNDSEVSTTSRKRKRTRRAGKASGKTEETVAAPVVATDNTADAEVLETEDSVVSEIQETNDVSEAVSDDTSADETSAEQSKTDSDSNIGDEESKKD
jgi:large subunit ribosomal protein L17